MSLFFLLKNDKNNNLKENFKLSELVFISIKSTLVFAKYVLPFYLSNN